jgi:transcriptional regulator with XRE-family HTH domain
MKEKVAERIRLLRQQKGLSQQNLADELGITVAAYSNIERGVTDVNMTRLEQIAILLNTTPSSLISDANHANDSSELVYGTLNNHVAMLSQQIAFLQKQVNILQEEMAVLKSK